MKKQKKQPLKWIFTRSKKQGVKMALLILANAFFSVLSVLFAFAIKEIIDSATIHNDLTRLISFSVAIGIIVILQFAFRIIMNYLTEHIRARLVMEYREHMFSEILVKKHDRISLYHSGELMNRLTSDVSVVADGVSTIVPTVVAAGVRLICAVVALIVLDWIFAVAFTVAGLLVFFVITLVREKLKGLHKGVQETDGKVRSFMQECIENLLAVKVFSVNNRIEKQVDKLQQEHYKVQMRRAGYSVSGHATYNFIFSAGYLFALIYGGVKILSGVLTYGSLSAILQLVNNVQVPFASLSNVLPKYYAMLASSERLMDIEDIENEPQGVYISGRKVYKKMQGIIVENATFSYGNTKVLNKANLKINKGDFIMIEGSSGAGKSTLIKLLLGIYPLDSGKISVQFDGEELNIGANTRALFSYVPQGNMLFSGTIRDNVTFIKDKATEKEIKKALKTSCADEFIDELPDGLETFVGENGLGLSEGQVQRLAIARALLCDAPIIVLDEATSALDEKTEKQLLDNLAELKDVTVILITHKKAAAKICNRRVKISAKRIVEM